VSVSAKTEYACLAMIDLAARYSKGEPVRIRDIAERHAIPSRFLVQILLQLKGAGLVVSTRGASGGYQLATDPRKITLASIVAVVEGASDADDQPASPDSPYQSVLQSVWREVARRRREVLETITLAELVERAARSPQPMYYI